VFVGRRGSPLAVSLVLSAYFPDPMVFAPARGGVADVTGAPVFGVVSTLASYEAAFGVGSVLAFAAAGLAAVGLVESRPTRGGSRPLATTDGRHEI